MSIEQRESKENNDILDTPLSDGPASEIAYTLSGGLTIGGLGYYGYKIANDMKRETIQFHENGEFWLTSPMVAYVMLGLAFIIMGVSIVNDKIKKRDIEKRKKFITGFLLVLWGGSLILGLSQQIDYNEGYEDGLQSTPGNEIRTKDTEAYKAGWILGQANNIPQRLDGGGSSIVSPSRESTTSQSN